MCLSYFRFSLVLALSLVAASCGGNGTTTQDDSRPPSNMLFTMSNGTAENEVLIFSRSAEGTLTRQGQVSTGGTGTGSGLENQGALTLSEDGRFLAVTNAASNNISVFRLNGGALERTALVSSGGIEPISVTLRKGLMYVLNAGGRQGGSDNVTGFRLASDGSVSQIPDSTRALTLDNTNPAQLELTPDTKILVVSERGTNTLSSFVLDSNALPGDIVPTSSAGPGPFGFAFRESRLFVAEARTNSASSYDVQADGSLGVITAALPTGQRAVCWLVISPNGSFAYTSNTSSSNITGISIAGNGVLSLLNADGITATSSAGPLDMAISPDGNFLYALTNGGTIDVFRIDASSGELSLIQTLGGIPAGSNGLAIN